MLTLNLIKNRFNKRAFLAEVKSSAQLTRDQSIEIFLETLMQEIPVWSGAAQATLIPLGRLIKRSVNITPKVNPPFKDPNEHGIAAGKKKGHAQKINVSYDYGFTFDHTLYHYFINENFFHNYGPTKKPTPWGTFNKASAAWNDFLRDHGSDLLPDVWVYLERVP